MSNNYTTEEIQQILDKIEIKYTYEEESDIKYVNIEEIVESEGVSISIKGMDDYISGYIHETSPDKYQIVANKNHHIHRQRFTMAHELGHYILHKKYLNNGRGTNDNKIYRATYTADFYNEDIDLMQESEANLFASRLLIPKDLIIEKVLKNNKKTLNNIIEPLNLNEFSRLSRSIKDEKYIKEKAKLLKVSPWALEIRLCHSDLDDIRDGAIYE